MNGPRLYVYGTGDPRLSRLLDSPSFSQLVARLMKNGVIEPSAAEAALLDDCLTSELLVRELSGFVPGPRLVLAPAAIVAPFTGVIAGHLNDYAAVASAALPLLRRAFLRTGPAKCFDWAHIQHVVLAGMFLDLAVGSCLWTTGIIHRRYCDTVLWAIDTAASRNPFGVQWIGSRTRRCAIAQLWHADVTRPPLRLAESDAGWLCAAASGNAVAYDPRMLLRLRYLGFVSRSADALRVTVPAFAPADCERLFPVLIECAMDLVRRVVRPLLADVDRFQPDGSMAQDSWRHVLIRLLLEAGIDRVVESGLCDPFPVGVPPVEWGRWSWEESACGHSLVAGAFEHVRAVATV